MILQALTTYHVTRFPEAHMARIRPNDIFDHLNPQMRGALDEAVDKTLPNIEADKRELYLAFRRERPNSSRGRMCHPRRWMRTRL